MPGEGKSHQADDLFWLLSDFKSYMWLSIRCSKKSVNDIWP
jgi:hypothetical protein